MDSVTELSPAGYVKEALNVLGTSKEQYGNAIEGEVARRKLEEIKDPQSTTKLETETDPFVNGLVDRIVSG